MMVSGFDNEVSILSLNIKIKIIINQHTASVELIAGFIKDVSKEIIGEQREGILPFNLFFFKIKNCF